MFRFGLAKDDAFADLSWSALTWFDPMFRTHAVGAVLNSPRAMPRIFADFTPVADVDASRADAESPVVFLLGSTSGEPPAESSGRPLPEPVAPIIFSLGVGPATGGSGSAIAMIDPLSVLPGTSATERAPGLVPRGGLVVLFDEDLGAGAVVDTATRTLLPGGVGDHPELGQGSDDVLVLSGPLASGSLPVGLRGLETIVLQAEADYDLASADANVGPGGTLTVNAMPLGAQNHAAFDGSAETDGQFLFLGGAGDDSFIGGAGDDRLVGMGGADQLRGGAGADLFGYESAGQSSGAGHDTLLDFDAAVDRIDLPVSVTGFDAAIDAGSLSNASFDDDLEAVLAGLGAGHAVLFAPDAGDLAGTVFLVVDGNGEAGYQAGEDYVFALAGADLGAAGNLGGSVDIFV